MIDSVELFRALVESEDTAERRRASFDEAPVEVWRSVLGGHEDLAFAVASNRTLPEEILGELCGNRDWRVRHRVAMKNSCPSDLLDRLSHDGSQAVALLVAGHRNTPSSALRRLTTHDWDQVRDRALDRLRGRDA
ncbi:hypothetical protein [Lentzea sp. NPDC055074]